MDDQENIVGVRCLAVPVMGPDADPIAAISVMGSTSEISEANWPKLVQSLSGAAARIGQRLGDGDRLKRSEDVMAAGRK